jgi:hypothetical protein
VGEPVDDLGSPAFGSLPGRDIPADRPVGEHRLPVDGERGPDLGPTNSALEVLEQIRLAGGRLKGEIHANQGRTGFCPYKRHCRG